MQEVFHLKKIGFIDYYLDEFHADKYPAWIEEASGGKMKVQYAYGKIDKPGGTSNADWCKQHGIELVDSIEEVVEKSDYLVVLSPDNPEFHEELSQLPLESGKPTYIDKTFAPDRDTALRLFQLAEKHGTPMYSTSALRFAEEYEQVEKGSVHTIASWGPGKMDNYMIHQVEPIVMMMKSRPRRVMYTGSAQTPSLIIDFGEGKQASLHHLGGNCPFMLGVSDASGNCRILTAESNFFMKFIENLVGFFDSGIPAVPSEETIDVITIIEYGLKASETPFEWLELPGQ